MAESTPRYLITTSLSCFAILFAFALDLFGVFDKNLPDEFFPSEASPFLRLSEMNERLSLLPLVALIGTLIWVLG